MSTVTSTPAANAYTSSQYNYLNGYMSFELRPIGNHLSTSHNVRTSYRHLQDYIGLAYDYQIQVVRDKQTGKTKGYGFVSFSSPSDLVMALKEMNGKYVGNRPVQLRKSKWKDRIDYEALVKRKNMSPKKAKSPKKSVLHK